MTKGTLRRTTGWHGPQKMVASGSGALQKDLPRALQVGDPRDRVPETLGETSLCLNGFKPVRQPTLPRQNVSLVDSSRPTRMGLHDIGHLGSEHCTLALQTVHVCSQHVHLLGRTLQPGCGLESPKLAESPVRESTRRCDFATEPTTRAPVASQTALNLATAPTSVRNIGNTLVLLCCDDLGFGLRQPLPGSFQTLCG